MKIKFNNQIYFNSNNQNKYQNIKNKIKENKDEVKLFAITAACSTACAFEKITDNFKQLTNMQKVTRIGKWSAIILTLSAFVVKLAHFDLFETIDKIKGNFKKTSN